MVSLRKTLLRPGGVRCISEWAKNTGVGVENHNGARVTLLPLIQPGIQRAGDNVDHILRRFMRLSEDGGFSGFGRLGGCEHLAENGVAIADNGYPNTYFLQFHGSHRHCLICVRL